MGIYLSEELIAKVRQAAEGIHHGRIIIEINTDKPDRVDVLVEYRERFKESPVELPGVAVSRAAAARG
jgi:hypothetical protein